MTQEIIPPKLKKTVTGEIETNSLADLLEWFLQYDEKVSIVRQTHVEEVFQWKQQDDKVSGINTFQFDNAEARFAIGCFQAIAENNSETSLNAWITDILNALQEAKQTNSQIAESYQLQQHGVSTVEQSNLIPTPLEKKIYLNSCWIEALCIAEARFLGWVYQEIYNKPFQPNAV
ncbi:MAG: hypothetical protein MUC29_00560 [Pyrinomonadaceae bacterium]|jgi:hypothetical protein|nr:hypothetical protein [Pyrinomonadaceae bacterium]